MGRLVFWLLVGAIIVALLRHAGRRAAGRRPPGAPPAAEDFVRCAHCGLNLPRSEAVGADGRWFCGEEHRRAPGSAGAPGGPRR